MRNYLLVITSIFVILAIPLGCATTKLEDYITKSTDEKEIIQVMNRTQKAWNNSDEDRFIAEFCPEGEFAFRATGTNRGDVRKVSKNEISSNFDSFRTNMGDFDIRNPKISITGDKADFSSNRFYYRYKWHVKIKLLRENGEWCINDWDFNLFY
jgi:hypothetical protein